MHEDINSLELVRKALWLRAVEFFGPQQEPSIDFRLYKLRVYSGKNFWKGLHQSRVTKVSSSD